MAALNSAPDRIGRYVVEELVGEGAMAKVYRARDPEIGRTVAIKVLKEELCVDEEYVTRFLREAKAAGAISHPNIVTIYDVGRTGSTPYITMEFLDEKSLAEILAEGTKLPPTQVISIAIQLARALDHAHRRGIVHRDVKPGNILMMEKGQTVKITDFGIARLDRSDDLQKTHAGTVLGTPRYMSPEQAAGQTVDGRSDLFSLGVILYEMVTGKKAFDSNNVATLILQIMQKDPVPIRTLAPEVPVGLQRIISKLLNKRPDQRFKTGEELAEALGRELAAITAQEEEAKRNRFVSLRVKWAASVGSAIAVVFLISMTVVYYVEARVIRAQVLDSGSSLAKFVALQNAVPALREDWVPVEVFVQDASARGTFDYLAITDHDHIVKASTAKDIVGKKFVPLPNAQEVISAPDLTATSVTLPDGKAAFLFDTPILFQKTEIGRIYLGIDRAGMDRVLSSTLFMMSNLGILTVLSAVGMLYVFGGLLARPLRSLSKSLQDFGAGDLDRRISEGRNDEIGQVFSAFNHMADAVQARFGNRQPSLPLPAVDISALANAPEGDTESTLVTTSIRAAVPADSARAAGQPVS
jgi:serine/threonine protein kinase/HAMP domain-containing protein